MVSEESLPATTPRSADAPILATALRGMAVIACIQSVVVLYPLFCFLIGIKKNLILSLIFLAAAIACSLWPAGTLRRRAALKRLWRTAELTQAVVRRDTLEFDAGRTFGRQYGHQLMIDGAIVSISGQRQFQEGATFPALTDERWVVLAWGNALVTYRRGK